MRVHAAWDVQDVLGDRVRIPAVGAEIIGDTTAMAAMAFQQGRDVAGFHLAQCCRSPGIARFPEFRFRHTGSEVEVIPADRAVAAHDDRTLKGIAQFTDVAGKVVGGQAGECLAAQMAATA